MLKKIKKEGGGNAIEAPPLVGRRKWGKTLNEIQTCSFYEVAGSHNGITLTLGSFLNFWMLDPKQATATSSKALLLPTEQWGCQPSEVPLQSPVGHWETNGALTRKGCALRWRGAHHLPFECVPSLLTLLSSLQKGCLRQQSSASNSHIFVYGEEKHNPLNQNCKKLCH